MASGAPLDSGRDALLRDQLDEAAALIARLEAERGRGSIEDAVLPSSYEAMHWGPLPGEGYVRPA